MKTINYLPLQFVISIVSSDAAQSMYKCKQLCDPTSKLIFSPNSFNIFSGELCSELIQDGSFIVDDSNLDYDCTEAQKIARISGCCRRKSVQGAIEEIKKEQTNDTSGGGSKRSLQGLFGFNFGLDLGDTSENIADAVGAVTEVFDVDTEDTAGYAINSVSNAIAGDITNTANMVNDGPSEIGDTLTENAIYLDSIMNTVDTIAEDTNAGSGNNGAIATLINDSTNAMDGTFTGITNAADDVENFVGIVADSTNIDSGNIDTIGDTSITQENGMTGVGMIDTAAVSQITSIYIPSNLNDINEAVGDAADITNAIGDPSIPQELLESMGTQIIDTATISEISQVDIASLNDINEAVGDAGEITNMIGDASIPQEITPIDIHGNLNDINEAVGDAAEITKSIGDPSIPQELLESMGTQMIDTTTISEISQVDIASSLNDINKAVGVLASPSIEQTMFTGSDFPSKIPSSAPSEQPNVNAGLDFGSISTESDVPSNIPSNVPSEQPNVDNTAVDSTNSDPFGDAIMNFWAAISGGGNIIYDAFMPNRHDGDRALRKKL